MGTEVHLLACGAGAEVVAEAEAAVVDRERRWSRFLPDSELSGVNAEPDVWHRVAPDTFRLIEAAVTAAAVTDGHFDPTVLHALVAAGYDRSFELVGAGGPVARGEVPWVPGASSIDLDEQRCSVRVAAGVGIDLGGIAKGHTADVVVAAMLGAGATGALANLGGDVRVAGLSPTGAGWRVGATDPFTGQALTTFTLSSGAVVTSTRLGRKWQQDGADRHHLIDPRTARPAASGVASVTIVGADAMWAEVIAKAVLVAGLDAGAALVERVGATGLVVTDDGSVITLPFIEDFAV